MANLISRYECTEMNPYAELGLLSEASLTSCSPYPHQAGAELKPVIDRRRPPGSAGLGRRGALWEAKNAGPLWRFATGVGGIAGVLAWRVVGALGKRGKRRRCPLPDLSGGVAEHTGAW